MKTIDDILDAIYGKEFPAIKTLSAEELALTDSDGRTPLMHAVLADDADPGIVQLLIDRGSDVNAFDAGQRWTPLHFAASNQKPEVVRVLLKNGATVDPVDVFGITPLWRSIMSSQNDLSSIKELLDHGADYNKKSVDGISPLDLARTAGLDDVVALLESRQ